jgi:hypothetical protein
MQTRNFCTLGSQYTASAINGVVPIVHSVLNVFLDYIRE